MRGDAPTPAEDEDQVYLRADQQAGEHLQQAQIPGCFTEEEDC